MGLLFGGCGGHHFEEVHGMNIYKIERTGFSSTSNDMLYEVKEKTLEKCKHEGCDKTRNRWKVKKTVLQEELNEFLE